MTEPHRCCQVLTNDLRAAHRRIGRVELENLLLAATIDGLRQELAAMTQDRDNWRISHAREVTTQHGKEAA